MFVKRFDQILPQNWSKGKALCGAVFIFSFLSFSLFFGHTRWLVRSYFPNQVRKNQVSQSGRSTGFYGKGWKIVKLCPSALDGAQKSGGHTDTPSAGASRCAWPPGFKKELAGKFGKNQHFLPQFGHHFCHLQKYTLLYLGGAINRTLCLFFPQECFSVCFCHFIFFPYHLGKSSGTHIPEATFPTAS